MKFLQLVRIVARVLLLLAGTGAAAVGALQFAPQGCAGPGRELPVSGLVKVAAPVALAAESGRVVRVVDGDTYDVLAGGQRVRLRLMGVDAPERDQPFGMQATDSVVALLPVGRLVQLRRRGTDLYGRTLGNLSIPAAGGPVPLDSVLVVRGWAWAYDPAHAVAGRAAQQVAAQQAGRGLVAVRSRRGGTAEAVAVIQCKK